MGKLVLAVVLLFAVTDWSNVLDKVEQQILRIEMQGPEDETPGVCSGIVINKEAGFLLSAAHCFEGDNLAVTVDKRHAEVVRTNRILDLAVVRFSPRPEHQQVVLAADVPKMGQEVAVIGFPFGTDKVHAQFGHISRHTQEGELWVNAVIIPGNSGGALFNNAGELVGVNVAVRYAFNGAAHMGVTVPLAALKDFIQSYLPKE